MMNEKANLKCCWPELEITQPSFKRYLTSHQHLRFLVCFVFAFYSLFVFFYPKVGKLHSQQHASSYHHHIFLITDILMADIIIITYLYRCHQNHRRILFYNHSSTMIMSYLDSHNDYSSVSTLSLLLLIVISSSSSNVTVDIKLLYNSLDYFY